MKKGKLLYIILCIAMLVSFTHAYANTSGVELFNGNIIPGITAELGVTPCPQCGAKIPVTANMEKMCHTCSLCLDCCTCGGAHDSYLTCHTCGDSYPVQQICPACKNCKYVPCCSCQTITIPGPSHSSLNANIKVSDRDVAVNEEVTFTAFWSGGKGPYSVQILAINTEIGDGSGVSGDSNSAESLSWSVSFPKAGTYVGQVRVMDANHDTVMDQTGVITVGGGGTHNNPEDKPSTSPTPAPSKPAVSKKLKIDYINPLIVSNAASSIVTFEIGISGATFPCEADYEITDEVTGKKMQMVQRGINKEKFQLLLGPDVSGAVKISVKVTDIMGNTDKKEQSTIAGKTSDATAETGRLRITGITPAVGSEMTDFTVTIAGGTPPFNMSYNLKYAKAGTENVWSDSIGNERTFKMMANSGSIEKIVFKVTDSKGASATKDYMP